MRITRSIVPNLFTLMNLFMGFTSIVYSAKGEFEQAAWLILVAAIFDMLDGVVARLLKAASELGAEMDSLCDAVSFGVAPSFMLYNVYFYQFDDIGILVASLPALAGVVRLARFNIQLTSLEDKLYFRGMPIPSAALVIVTYVIFYHRTDIIPDYLKDYIIFAVTISTALIMISNIKFDNLPRPTKKSFKQRPVAFIVFIIGFTVCAVTRGEMIFPFMVFIIIVSTIRHLIVWFKETREASDDFDESEEPQQSLFDL